ncbi:ABC transporter substrate-binding protein [Pseudomonas sp. LS-2]|uniref:ABC transporter substrate-binding protein n=1 Tax=Pseudomonas sp. LS-2 TaxID=2315859 RepID=UPI000E768BF2|nr:ABC transporter substrate-binding protein [Pseudomonas sp. LS-2]RJX77840.1 ABC transporter substrate-binding protein [Pseudomonas sp. LS-2]
MSVVSVLRNRLMFCAFSALACVLSPATTWANDLASQAVEPGAIDLGMNPWIGYGPWIIAEKKGLYKKNGLQNVKLVSFTEDKDRMAAFASGRIDFMNIPAHTALQLIENGIGLKIVLLLDYSLAADAIVADNVKSVADLKGKQVAYEESSTSDILLNHALAKNGLSLADIERVPMPAAQAGSALVAGRVPVAVTYEPYLSAAMAQNKNAKLIYTAGEAPGLISDVLVVSDKALKEKPGQIMALIKSWKDAMSVYKQDVKAGREVIASGVGSPVEELETAFNGVQFYDVAENKTSLASDFGAKVLPEVSQAAVLSKILQANVPTQGIVDDRFVRAVP